MIFLVFGADFCAAYIVAEAYRSAHPIPASEDTLFFIYVVMMRFIVVLSFLVALVMSETMAPNTTSGQLLGSEADGGMCCLCLLIPTSPK
jgi:hypothetical protein